MFNGKKNIKMSPTLEKIDKTHKIESIPVEAQLMWANNRIRELKATIESFRLKHEIAHYASIFMAAGISKPSDNNLEAGLQSEEYEERINTEFVQSYIKLAKIFVKEMKNDNIK